MSHIICIEIKRIERAEINSLYLSSFLPQMTLFTTTTNLFGNQSNVAVIQKELISIIKCKLKAIF